MSDFFSNVFEVINTVREKVSSCKNSENILQGFGRRAEGAPTLLSQGLTQALTFYLYKVEELNKFVDVYGWLFKNRKPNIDVCKNLADDDEGYLLYTSVLFYLFEKLGVECKVEDVHGLKTCLTNISGREANIYRKLINYVIELKKISKIMLSEEETKASTQSR